MTVEATQEQTPKNTHVIVNAAMQRNGRLEKPREKEKKAPPEFHERFERLFA
jgi:hypothetical protein